MADGNPNQAYYTYDSQKTFDDGTTNGASAPGDGYGYGMAGETFTDPNAMGTEQAQQDYYDAQGNMMAGDAGGGDAGGGDAMSFYDPAQYQSYYYQDDDGNYYYYADPQTEMLNETMDNAGVAPTAQNLVRSYEYEDWEPRRYNWFIDIVLGTFFSKPFKLYLTLLLYCGTVVVVVMGLDFSFALLFRLYYPPNRINNVDLEAFSYLTMFFYLSFVIVSTLCAVMDMTRNLWWQKREDLEFWGCKQRCFSKRKPPYMIYLLIVLLTVPLPLLWGVIDAASNKQSLVFFAQRYANVAVLVGTFLIVACYVWFFILAFVRKRDAVKHAKDRDDYRLREKAFKHRPEKLVKMHWYHAQTILEEFGVDPKTLRYDSIVFTVGLVPIFALYAAQALTTYTGAPTVVWGAISSIALICVYIVTWLTFLRHKGQWAIYISFVLDVVFFIIGVVGAGIGGDPKMVGVIIVLFVACQGMITRKRKHSLTRKELCATLRIPLNRTMETVKQKKRVDSYLFCCRDLLLDYMRCCDVKTYFGYRHPDVIAAERRYAIENIALRTDQKVMLVWWLVVMFAAAFVIALGNAVRYEFNAPIAVAGTTPIVGDNEDSHLCEITYNRAGAAPLKMFDLALLSALSYTYGTSGNTDFATWFSQSPTLQRRFPEHLPPTLNFATDGIEVRFSDFVDTSSDFHFITINTNSRGMSLFRNTDEWGESIAIQIMAAISPLVSFWPERYRADFVQVGAFLKMWFPPSPALVPVRAYIDGLLAQGLQDQILLVGEQFNGGYAKLLSSEYGLRFVAFNPPGVKYKVPFLYNGTQLSSVRGLWSYIDSLEDTANTLYMPCNDTMSSTMCGRISTTIDDLLAACGDPQGRTMVEGVV